MNPLQEAMDYWDGFGVQIEWYTRVYGAVGIVGSDLDALQIMTITIDGNGVAHTECAEPTFFSTGGPEI